MISDWEGLAAHAIVTLKLKKKCIFNELFSAPKCAINFLQKVMMSIGNTLRTTCLIVLLLFEMQQFDTLNSNGLNPSNKNKLPVNCFLLNISTQGGFEYYIGCPRETVKYINTKQKLQSSNIGQFRRDDLWAILKQISRR